MNIQQSINQAITATAFLASQSPAYKEHRQKAALERQQRYTQDLAGKLGSRASELEADLIANYETYDEDTRQGTAQQIQTLRNKADEQWNKVLDIQGQRAALGEATQYVEELEQLGFGSSDARLQKARAQAEIAAKTKKKARRKGGAKQYGKTTFND